MKTQDRAFTLIELLVVITVIAILAVLTTPALNTMLQGMQLSQSTKILYDQLNYARQAAVSSNRVIEVRFYQCADPAGGRSNQSFRAFQIFQLQNDGTAIPLDRVYKLTGVIIDSGTNLSSLLGPITAKQWTATDKKIPLPQIGINYTTNILDLRPDNTTNLTMAGQPWFVTLHHENKGDHLNALPSNFAILQIDPMNGTIQTYRP